MIWPVCTQNSTNSIRHRSSIIRKWTHAEISSSKQRVIVRVINFSYAPKKKGEAVMRMREGNRKK